MKGSGDVLLTHILEGERLAAINRVLRWHGITEVEPCAVGRILQHLSPMEMGRYAHIVHEIVAALDETSEEIVT